MLEAAFTQCRCVSYCRGLDNYRLPGFYWAMEGFTGFQDLMCRVEGKIELSFRIQNWVSDVAELRRL